VASVGSFDSLGNLYSYVTHLSGFQAEKHEGKVTGLAAAGEPRYAGVLRRFVRYDDPGGIRYPVPMYHRSALRRLAAALPAEALTEAGRADLAASVQLVLEEVATAFVRHWLRRTGLRRLAVAGGVFANVKLNQRLHELEEVDELWVYPAMDDGGLAVGGALLEQAEARGAEPLGLKGRLDHVYLGPGIGEREAADAVSAAGLSAAGLSAAGLSATKPADPYGAVAELLAGGAVVAVCTGAMEHGPRALGHRSILYRADDPSVDHWLNRRLRRSDFMPFAPATLAEHAGDLYRGLDGARDPARFMTLTFDCTPKMRAQSPAVVHVDGTARPQLVDAATAPELHAILTAYHRLTSVPTVINTSFNLHEEPIVCTAEEAVRAFLEGQLDHLLLGPLLVSAPR
jgi:carbamoyltransferase